MGAMADDGESMLELFGALTNCLARAIARMSLDQLNGYEAEVLQMLQSQHDETVAANAFRSVLREIDSRRAHLFAQ
jgi:hypothetical protein